ncbi:hypothetical protein HS088_TW02G00485 [Tripterygium wilfordii]|uniref:Uncharacterized protein n=1 Tax=Tripterygium wilfordii TaxID=458696 RepID=A0A7J7DYY8_TRIWF|nr:uncharacterized protein LOC120005027 [Tripterygium wilfordii]KAF5751471.1 hypothetical protein HS088_TW02G00485 [Tripterygium wilfordii]
MISLSGLGIGLGVAFGCLLLALIAQLSYLIWWKRRLTCTEVEDDYSNKFLQFICFKRPFYLQKNKKNQEIGGDPVGNGHGQDIELGLGEGIVLKIAGEESVEGELMRLHNLAGPPRFLFTIKEETKEDLESEDGKSRGDGKSRKGSRTRSLSDLILAVDTPFVSPPLKSSLDSYSHHGFNPLFESITEAELNRLRSSPPPKFKFMRDADEKLQRKLMEESERKKSQNGVCAQDSRVEASNSTMVTEGINGSFVNFLVSTSSIDKEKELLHHLTQYPSSTAQVLPLASSPPGSNITDH